VFPVGSFTGRALDFLGYRIWPTHRRVRKSSISRIKRTLRLLQKLYSRHQIQWPRVRQSITSWLEHAKHADAAGLRESVMSKFVFTRPLK
jgi:hypothetical protein